MYGSTGASTYDATHANTNSSTIKQYLDSWYETNIEDAGYGDAVSDTLFCGDRSLDTTSSSYTGIGTTLTYYGAYNRLVTNKEPILTCPQKNDAYTVDDETNGNGALTYPIALISADEVAMAGGVFKTSNTGYYLYKGSFYLSLSPYYSGSSANVFIVSNDLSANVIIYAGGVAPVINLTAKYVSTMTGTGTMTDPYTA